MSAASRWAVDELASASPQEPRSASSDYDDELRDVLGDATQETRVNGVDDDEEDVFQYTGTDSVTREAALGEMPADDGNHAHDAFDYDAQLASLVGDVHGNQDRVPTQTASFPRAQLPPHPEHSDAQQDDAAASSPIPGQPHPPALSETASPPASETSASHPAAAKPPPFGSRRYSAVARRPPLVNAQLSRLRSSQRFPSSSSFSSFASEFQNKSIAADSSKFGALSRHSSASNIKDMSTSSKFSLDQESNIIDLEALSNLASSTSLRWNPLRRVSTKVFTSAAAAHHGQNGVVNGIKGRLLPDAHLGHPSCMSANGMICIGTTKGWTLVFDFAQTLKCVCGNESIAESSGSVTALAVSSDHTFVAVGHATGTIHLYLLSKPAAPARTVNPTDLRQVLSGRAEGHLEGTCIRHIDFIGARHTAIVSSDDRGLAFFHHLGQVLGLANTNVVRIIGRYPMNQAELEAPPPALPSLSTFLDTQDSTTNAKTLLSEARHSQQQEPSSKPVPSVSGLAPLPLGPQAHETDSYSLVAIITPFKLLIAALKPTPRTLWRLLNKPAASEVNAQTTVGSLSWWPSSKTTPPALAFSWGHELRIVSVHEEREPLTNDDKVDAKEKERRSLKFVESGHWKLEEVALRVIWLNARTLLLVCPTHLSLWDTIAGIKVGHSPLDLRTLLSPQTVRPNGDATPNQTSSTRGSILAAQNISTYKGKVFALALADVRVATILTWADRIIALVNSGSLVEAIELTTLFYQGQSNNASIGLADDADARHDLVAPKLREIMLASMEYVFSEDRLSDHTHVTANGQGVDRTALFESLVDACVRACIACDDLNFVFSDLFEKFQDSGILGIFLRRIKPFVLSGTLPAVPTNVSSQLVDYCEEQGQVEKAEQVVYHVDPASLDLDRVLKFARRHELQDCQIYVETTVLQDWKTPFGRLLQTVGRIEKSRHDDQDRDAREQQVPEAYSIFVFTASSLNGLAFPTGIVLQPLTATEGRKQLYSMLFAKSPLALPGSKRPLTVTDDNTPYPYLTLLLRFDTEAILDALDQALEDSFLDEHPVVSRQEIIDLLLNLAFDATSYQLSSADLAFIYIFVARNLPKYPQFISISDDRLEKILLALLQDPDQSTREDRQLATEFLFSVFKPHNMEPFLPLLQEAGFFRVLRAHYRSHKQWAALAKCALQDPELGDQVFDQLAQTFRLASKAQASDNDLLTPALLEGIPQLVEVDLGRTVELIAQNLPQHHLEAIGQLENQVNRRFAYLRYLMDPDEGTPNLADSMDATEQARLREAYVELLCQFDPQHVVPYLSNSDQEVPSSLIATCEKQGVDAAVIWSYGRNGDVKSAVQKLDQVVNWGSAEIWKLLKQEQTGQANGSIVLPGQDAMEKLLAAVSVSIQVCASRTSVDKEDVWLGLLSSLVGLTSDFTKAYEASHSEGGGTLWMDQFKGQIDAAIPDALSALMSSSSLDDISFSRLTKRLIQSHGQSNFGDFRPFLHGIEEAYRFEGETLRMAKQLVGEDLFNQGARLRKEMSKGWSAGAACCEICRLPAWGSGVQTSRDRTRHDAVSVLMEQLPPSAPRETLLQRKASLKGKEAYWPEDASEGVMANMPEHSPDDSLRALVVTRAGGVYHRSCYEHGSAQSDEANPV